MRSDWIGGRTGGAGSVSLAASTRASGHRSDGDTVCVIGDGRADASADASADGRADDASANASDGGF